MDKHKPKQNAPPPANGEQWGLDPHDVRFHARRMREEKVVGPLGKLFRIAAAALVLVGAFAAYRNFDTLTRIRFDFSALTSAPATDTASPQAAGELGTEVVEATQVAGVSIPTSPDGAASEAEVRAAANPFGGPGATEPEPAAAAAPAAPESAPQPIDAAAGTPAAPPEGRPEPVEEQPPAPEMFGFGLSVMNVSEADASAAVLVLRDGGRRGVSFITWWTTDGTAKAGSDFAGLEPRVERFATGEQNRTIRVPIVGDRNVEGPESFFVNVVAGESAAGQPVATLEVVITDDD